MSSAALPYMPSQLLLQDLVDLNVDDQQSNVTTKLSITDATSQMATTQSTSTGVGKFFDIKPKNAIMELFNKTSNVDTMANKQNNPSSTSKSTNNKGKLDRKDKAAWFKLFSELDPLANPDLMEKKISDGIDNSSQAV